MVKMHEVLFIKKCILQLLAICCSIKGVNSLEEWIIHFRVCSASRSGLFSCNNTPLRVPYLISILILVSQISRYMRFLFLMLCQSLFSQSSTAICDIGPTARGKMSKCHCLYFYVKLQILCESNFKPSWDPALHQCTFGWNHNYLISHMMHRPTLIEHFIKGLVGINDCDIWAA